MSKMFFASEIIKRIYFMNYKTKLTSVMLSMTTAVLLTGSAAIPLVANAALTQAQIQSILSLLSSFGADQTTINNVNSSLMGLPTSGAPTASAGACGFTRDLTMGARGDDVTCLQNYLTSTGHFSFSGGATGYFGSVSKNAVAAWQAANGVSPTAGYFGALSRAKYNAVAGGVVSVPGAPSVPGVPATAGTLRVEAGVQPNASLIPINATRVPFTVVKFTAPSNQDVTINSLVVQRTGLASDSAISGVVLLDETGAQLGVAKTLNSTHQTTLTEPFVVRAGTSRIMTIGGNAETSNGGLAGQVVYLTLKQVNSSAAAIDGALDISGAGHTVNESLSIGSVTMLRGSLDPGSSATKKVGETDYVFASVKVTSGSFEKVYLRFIRWNQTGSVGAGDLANIKTYVDGTAYDTIVSSDGKYYTAMFSDNGGKGILIDKGFSKEASIKGDITGGSGRTIDFDLAKRTDLGLLGETYGYGITPPQTGTSDPTDDTAAFSSTEDPWYDAAQVLVSTGSITVSVANSIPAQNVAINLANQTLGGFTVEVKGEQISVGRIDFFFMAATSSTYTSNAGVAGTNVTNITLVDPNGAIIAGPADGAVVKNGHGKVRFTDTVTFPVGTGIYTLKGKFSTTFTTNNVFQASTTPSADWATVRGLTTGNSITPSPTSVITANQMTIKAGALAVSVSSVPIAQTVIAGSSQFLFANYVLDGTGSGEDLRLTSIPVVYHAASGGSATDNTNCKLYDGSTVVSVAVNPSASGSSTNFTFLSNGLTLPKGTSKTLGLKCDVIGGSTGSYGWGIEGDDNENGANSADWTGVSGLTSGQTIAQTITESSGQLMSAASGGTINVVLDSGSPSYKIVAAGQTGVELAKIRFSATNEDIDLKQVALIISGAASNTPVDLVGRQVTLWEGSTQVGTAVFPTSYGATSSAIAIGSFRIPRNGAKVLTIKGDIAGVSVDGPMVRSGDLLKVNYDGANAGLNGNYGTGASSGNTINGATTVTASQGVRIMKAYPSFAYYTVPTTSLNNAANQKIYRFSVTANNGDVALFKFSFTVGSSTLSDSAAKLHSYKLYVYTDLLFTTIDSNFTSSGAINNGAAYVANLPPGKTAVSIYPDKTGWEVATTTYTVSSGVTRYFELRATAAGLSTVTTSKDTITVQLDGDAAFPTDHQAATVLTPLGDMGAAGVSAAVGVDSAADNDFIWSPISTTTQVTVYDFDYTNGYQVSGLPASGMSQNTFQSQ
ncbi:MAG: hypothetical protein UW15_C0008G0026 [Parcubacteria group bacterium GW2011_GWC1_44_10]|nr:MAG: hypothetical protein UW15_C0008G0026 [Parcubacteria group bacterium GW2011_GWC1_44_10]